MSEWRSEVPANKTCLLQRAIATPPTIPICPWADEKWEQTREMNPGIYVITWNILVCETNRSFAKSIFKTCSSWRSNLTAANWYSHAVRILAFFLLEREIIQLCKLFCLLGVFLTNSGFTRFDWPKTKTLISRLLPISEKTAVQRPSISGDFNQTLIESPEKIVFVSASA